MKLKALRPFQSTTLGDIKENQEFEVKNTLGYQYIATGMAIEVKRGYDTKVVEQVPLDRPLPLSPVAPASPAKIAKKRGRKRKSSRSTTQ